MVRNAYKFSIPQQTGPGFNAIIDVLTMKKYSWNAEGGAPTIEDIPAEEMEKATALNKNTCRGCC